MASSRAEAPGGGALAQRLAAAHSIEVMAVAVLDEIASQLIRANRFGVPREFLAWVETEATPQVERRARQWARRASARAMPVPPADCEVVRRLVYDWVMPQIAERFGALTASTPQFAPTDAMPARRPAGCWAPIYPIDLVLD